MANSGHEPDQESGPAVGGKAEASGSPEQSYLRVSADGSGVLRTTGSGFWSVEQVKAYFVEYRRLIEKSRSIGKPVRALINVGPMPVQGVDVLRCFQEETANLYRDGDRIAILIESSLARMQGRRVLEMQHERIFASKDLAEAWLQEG